MLYHRKINTYVHCALCLFFQKNEHSSQLNDILYTSSWHFSWPMSLVKYEQTNWINIAYSELLFWCFFNILQRKHSMLWVPKPLFGATQKQFFGKFKKNLNISHRFAEALLALTYLNCRTPPCDERYMFYTFCTLYISLYLYISIYMLERRLTRFLQCSFSYQIF